MFVVGLTGNLEAALFSIATTSTFYWMPHAIQRCYSLDTVDADNEEVVV